MEIKTPDLGVDSAEVSEIMVAVGDIINEGDNIVLLESDKASVEVPSTVSGKINSIMVSEGDTVSEGVVLMDIEAGDAQVAQEATSVETNHKDTPAVNEQAAAPVEPAQVPQPASSVASQITHALPDLGVDEAQVAEVMVQVGDVVEAEQSLILVESDKASVEVPAPVSGKVVQLLINTGDTVANGQDFIVIESGSDLTEQNSSESTSVAQSASASASAQSVSAPSASTSTAESTHALPDLGVDEAQVAEIMVSEGDTVELEQSLMLVESDKASVEVPAPVAGKVVKLLVNAGDTVANGQDFVVIASASTSDATVATSEIQQPVSSPANTQQQAAANVQKSSNVATNTTSTTGKLTETEVNAKFDASMVYAGPAVRKLARQLGVDITQVQGSAVNKRIIKEDLFSYVKGQLNTASAPAKAPAKVSNSAVASLPPLPDMSKTELWGDIEREALTRLQKVSIPQLNYNTLIPQVTQFDLADITETENFRGSIKAEYKAQGIGLTILAFIIKAVAYALIKHPKFNSHLSDDNTELLIRKSVNMGIAVATPEGLVVPVIKNAQDKGIKQIAIEVGELAKKARDKKLTPKDITGASFTISSQGNLGGTAFTPLVTWPQVGILGISESSMQPRWNAGKAEFEPRLMLPLSLSYDHRVINGADAAVFTRYVATLLADPRKILM